MMDSYVWRDLIYVKATSKNCTFKSVNLIEVRQYSSTRVFAIGGILLASARRRSVERDVYVQTSWIEPTSGGKSSS
jgi:hypothetical protein